MNVNELNEMFDDILFINDGIKKLEYHEKNTLSSERKSLHRNILIPSMDIDIDEFRDIIKEAKEDAKRQNLSDTDNFTIPREAEREIKQCGVVLKMYKSLIESALINIDN